MIETLVDLGQSFNSHIQSALTAISSLLSENTSFVIPDDIKAFVSFYFPIEQASSIIVLYFSAMGAIFSASVVKFAIGFIKH